VENPQLRTPRSPYCAHHGYVISAPAGGALATTPMNVSNATIIRITRLLNESRTSVVRIGGGGYGEDLPCNDQRMRCTMT
jgi:hypothetical protein